MPVPRRTLLAFGAALLAASACRDPIDVPRSDFKYGVVVVPVTQQSAVVAARPVGTFFTSSPLVLPTSESSEDSCVIENVLDPTTQTPDLLDAGAAITVAAGSQSVSLARLAAVAPNYAPGASESLAFGAGDSVTITVPGAAGGFPATALRAKTAEPFTLAPLPGSPTAGQAITLSWTPAGDSHSKMVAGLQYASLGSTTINRQIFCVLIDDGSYTVPDRLLSQWRTATNGNRTTLATRWRTRLSTIGADAVLLVISTFDVTGTFTP